MIASLSGTVESKSTDEAVVEVGGVGYRLFLSLRSMALLPAVGERTKVRVRTVVREDAFDLYGFTSEVEEALFLLLTSVSHIGPKLAMTVLSGMEPSELAHTIAAGDLARLTRLHGVGKKTAERMVVELKDKVLSLAVTPAEAAEAPPRSTGLRADLIGALVNLGYKPAQAELAAEQAQEKAGPGAAIDTLIREALRAARG